MIFTARGTSDHAALYAAYLTEIRLGIPAGPGLAVGDHGLRRPARPARLPGRRGVPERRLARPAARCSGSPGAGRAHAGRDQRARLAARRGGASCTSTSPPAPSGPSRRPRPTRPSCWRCCCWSRASVRADGALPAASGGAGELPELAPRGPWPTSTAAEIAGRYRFAGAGGHHRARLRLPDRPRGGAEADGDLVPRRAGLLRRRPAARPAGDGRRGRAGAGRGRHRAGRAVDARRAGPAAPSGGPTSSSIGGGRPGPALHLPTPDVDERYAPLLDILPLQQLALALALARGEDPDAPRGLKKVTATL